MAPIHTMVKKEMHERVKAQERASWADAPFLKIGNFETNDMYEPQMGVECPNDSWEPHVLNWWSYKPSYKKFRLKRRGHKWIHFLWWSTSAHPVLKWLMFWRWRTFVSVAWWDCAGYDIIQGIVYPLHLFRMFLIISLFASPVASFFVWLIRVANGY